MSEQRPSSGFIGRMWNKYACLSFPHSLSFNLRLALSLYSVIYLSLCS
jgi:hypothetical protein